MMQTKQKYHVLATHPSYAEITLLDPADFDTLAIAEMTLGLPIVPIKVTAAELEQHLIEAEEKSTSFSLSADQLAAEFQHTSGTDSDEQSFDDILRRTESEPVVRMAALIFDEAIKNGASDVHIEPAEKSAAVRFRIDGMLVPSMELPRQLFTPVTSRIKIMACLDIAEKRAPQDGRIRYNWRGQDYDFRVSTLPTHYGEKTVIRILKHDISLTSLANLGMPVAMQEQINELINKPQGMIFVTGPTGSGKSSTLFACLNKIRQKSINITTIEDPVEYKIAGVNQVQINEKAGVTFVSALRSILRQDPDVILVGEIRDAETAKIAMQASQTGHLVFSTLHTNDAVSAITRLHDLGIPGFLVASSVIGVLAQRLVRVLCESCRKEAPHSEEIIGRWKLVMGSNPIPGMYQACGCDNCGQTGYRGRTAIFEFIPMTEPLRVMIAKEESDTSIRQFIRTNGTHSLLADGLSKVRDGVTTPEELLRVVLIGDADFEG